MMFLEEEKEVAVLSTYGKQNIDKEKNVISK